MQVTRERQRSNALYMKAARERQRETLEEGATSCEQIEAWACTSAENL